MIKECPKCKKTMQIIKEPNNFIYYCEYCNKLYNNVNERMKNHDIIETSIKNLDLYNNTLKAIVSELKAEYYQCGSHKMELTINMDKIDIINLLRNILENNDEK